VARCDSKKTFDTLQKYLRESYPETKIVMLVPVWNELKERAVSDER